MTSSGAFASALAIPRKYPQHFVRKSRSFASVWNREAPFHVINFDVEKMGFFLMTSGATAIIVVNVQCLRRLGKLKILSLHIKLGTAYKVGMGHGH